MDSGIGEDIRYDLSKKDQDRNGTVKQFVRRTVLLYGNRTGVFRVFAENDYSIAFDKKFFLDRSNLSMQDLLTYLVQATNKNSIN